MAKKTFLEVLKEKRAEKAEQIKILDQAIEIVERDNDWNIIMQAREVI